MSVRVLSRLFKGKFIDSIKKLKLYDSHNRLIDFQVEPYKSLIDELYSKEWVVYSKKPFGNNQAVLNYIGRYSHRVAISNSRILNYDHIHHTVTFRYKDYRDDSKQKEMTLDACEFLRRFMQHILPSRFIKIRHYGFMSNSSRKAKIPLCRTLLNQTPPRANPASSDLKFPDFCTCPKCKGKFVLVSRKIASNSILSNNSS